MVGVVRPVPNPWTLSIPNPINELKQETPWTLSIPNPINELKQETP